MSPSASSDYANAISKKYPQRPDAHARQVTSNIHMKESKINPGYPPATCTDPEIEKIHLERNTTPAA